MLFPYRGVSDPSRIRTCGLMVRSHALYLLSYGTEKMTLEGFAPPTLRSVGVCSESAELQGHVYRAQDLHLVLPLHRRAFCYLYQLGSKRTEGVAPSASSLGSSRSTAELRPHDAPARYRTALSLTRTRFTAG